MDSGVDRHLFDRRLYMTTAIGFAAIVLIGFGRTYYARSWFGLPPLPSSLVHLHGLLMSAWVILFAAQVRFISVKQVRLHQRLGYAGIALGALIIATGVPTAVRAAKYGSTAAPPDISPLAFLIVPLFDLLMFTLFFGAAIYYRRQAAAHKRLMLLTAINFLPPALARIPTERLQALGPLWFFGFPTAIAVLCLTIDARRHGRINRVFLAGTILLVCSYVARLGLMTTQVWMNVAAWLTSFA
jgi:hypothetical protein